MSDRISLLSGDVTLYTRSENNRKQVKWTGSATGTQTYNAVYSAIQAAIDASALMDDKNPMRADTPTIYRLTNQWFADDDTMEHFTGGSCYSDGWQEGTNDHVKIIGYAQTTEFDSVDIGRTIVGGTTGDTGTLLDFNTNRTLAWIRPNDPTQTTGDAFDNGTEAYSIQDDAVATAYAFDGAAYNDETTDINSATANDVSVFLDVSDATYFGFGQEFSKIVVNVGTAGTGGVLTWEYWNGAWTALSGVTDGTNSYQTSGTNNVTFTVPTDWAETTVSVSGSLFWVRARVTTTLTGTPLLTQAWIGGVGAGAFQSHTRHGAGSVAGESTWAGITSDIIGVTPNDGHVYLYQEDPDAAEGGFSEVNVVATKGTTDWWGNGNIDISLKTKEADSIFGKSPDDATKSYLTMKIQQFANLYGSRTLGNISTDGGNHAIAVSVDNDLNSELGYRQTITTTASAAFTVDEIIQKDGDSTVQGVVLSSTGTAPNVTIQYYLYGDPLTDFVNSDTITGLTSGSTATIVTPTDVNAAADTGITMTSGAHTLDINNGNGARKYSIELDPNSVVIARTYRRMQYNCRRGNTSDFDASVNHTVVGEAYVGNEVRLTYGTQTGNYTEGLRVTQAVSGATGIIVADHDDGTSGNLILRDVRGTFNATNIVTDTSTGSATATAVTPITPVAAAPLGTYAGGKFFGAPGVSVVIANLAAGESQAYQLIDDLGITQQPPNSITITQSNLVAGDACAIYRLTGSGGTIDVGRYSGAAGNNQGDSTIEVSATIDTDNSTLANSKVFIQSASGTYHRYRYDSYTGTTWTLSPATAGLADAGGDTTTLIDTGSNFTTDEVEVGDLVRNTDDNVWSEVVSVDSATQLTVTNNGTTWASKNFSLNTLVETYASGQNVSAAILDRVADAATENNQLILGSSFFALAVVRNAGTIEPFEQEVEITGDTTIPTIRNADGIFTP